MREPNETATPKIAPRPPGPRPIEQSIPFIPFGRPDFGDEEIEAVARVMRSGWIGPGLETARFEQELAGYLAATDVVCVSSCTAALALAMRVCGIGPGDEVIVPSLTWCSTANAALYAGATPVLADVDPATLCLDPASVAACVTPRTRAVIPVHFGGLSADLKALGGAVPRGVRIVEDAAHALGGRDAEGWPVGSSGNLVCFSFYANKNLSTGDGGAIALSDAAEAARLRLLRQMGQPADAWRRYVQPGTSFSGDITELGYKAGYSDLHAAIGRVQLRRQPEMAARRLSIARRYAEAAERLGLGVQRGCADTAHARHLFVVMLPLERMRRTRDEVVSSMRAAQVGATIHYTPLHHLSLYRELARVPLPVTEQLAPRLLTLPISASMSEDDVARTIAALEEAVG